MLEKYFSPDMKKIWEDEGIKELNPHQKQSLDLGLLDGENILISAPTASGKTLIAEFASIDTVLKRNKKVVYIVPLKALASEKYHEFKEKYEKFGIKTTISVGDLDQQDDWLKNYDIIIVTSEKMDSLIRHNVNWIRDIGLVIVDEIHLLNDPGRGPTLEVVITRLRDITKSQILGLSATVNNAPELAGWLNAKCIISNYRPVELHEGVYDNEKIIFPTKGEIELDGIFKPEENLCYDTIEKNKQALVFVSSRRNAEACAENIGKAVKNIIPENDKEKLKELSEKIYNTLDSPTKQCKRLAGCILHGTAFHHAGLVYKQRKLIEDAFKSNIIKVISSTPTLAIGVNIPAYRVIIRDIMRYYGGRGMDYIPTMEYKQMSGRAGRPKYENEGEAILISKNETQTDELLDRYVLGETEDIYSKLSLEPVLRMHTLALIASGNAKSEEDIMGFFGKTFYAYQYGDVSRLEQKISNILSRLQEHKLIVNLGGEVEPTRLGKRVSELYIDPETAIYILDSLKVAQQKQNPYGYLFMISSTLEMAPGIRVSKTEMEDIYQEALRKAPELFEDVPDEWDLDFETFLPRFKSAMMLNSWINEITDDILLKDYKMTPGELRAKLEITDWLLYATKELAFISDYKDCIKEITKIRIRMKNGIKEELLPLISLKNVGRMRARKLFSAGLRTIDSLRKVEPERLARIIGPATASSILKQVSGKEQKILVKKDVQQTLNFLNK